MSEWIDLSLTLCPKLPVWPGCAPVALTHRKSMSCGDPSNNTNLSLNCHTGTHVDAPLHFLAESKPIDEIPLDLMIGEAWVLDLSHASSIELEDLKRAWPKGGATRVLLKTKNSELWDAGVEEFKTDFIALTEEPASWLRDQGVKLIGIDYLSIQPYKTPPRVHELLLEKEIVLIEGLNLSKAPAGRCELVCMPLKIRGGDAAPARVAIRPCSSTKD